MPVTVRGTDILFNDGTTQSTAASVVPSDVTVVGAIIMGAINTTTGVKPGDTIAGSNVWTPNAYVGTIDGLYFSNGTVTLGLGSPNTCWGATPSHNAFLYNLAAIRVRRMASGNTGFLTPLGSTSYSGTWRILGFAAPRASTFDGYYGYTGSGMSVCLVQRIS